VARGVILAVLAILVVLSAAAPAQAEESIDILFLQDGTRLEGRLAGLTGHGTFRMFQAGRRIELPTNQVLAWSRSEQVADPTYEWMLEIVDGSIIVARDVTWKPDGIALTVRTDHDGVLRIMPADLAALHRHTKHGTATIQFVRTEAHHGRLTRTDDVPLDGIVVGVNEKHVLWKTAVGVETVPFDEMVRALVPVGTEEHLKETDLVMTVARVEHDGGWYASVRTIDGAQYHGMIQAFDADRMVLATGWGGNMKLDRKRVLHARFGFHPGTQQGRTLVLDAGRGKIYAVDRQGNQHELLSELSNPHDIDVMPDGRLLVVERGRSAVVIYDANGRQIWESEEINDPTAAAADHSGGFLVCDLSRDRIHTVSRNGDVTATLDRLGTPVEVDPLPNGNLLICEISRERVIESTPDGKIVWQVEDVGYPADADRLANGNTLITDTENARVFEVNREGTVVWELKGLSAPFDADRVQGGNTIVVENRMGRVREFNPYGDEVWRTEGFHSILEVERD
jgi:glucose/arabinose dehydrogenase